MELWVRSQDKESLLMIKKMFYHCTCDEVERLGEHYIGNKEWVGDKDYTLLGKYKTKERALEVLDEIQGIIIAKYISDINFKAAFSRIENEKSAEYLLNQMAVYEMPKE